MTTRNCPNFSLPKYLDPAKIIAMKLNEEDEKIFYSDSFLPKTRFNLAQKYFGKKIIPVDRASDLAKALNRCKLMTKIELSYYRLQSDNFKSKGSKLLCFGAVKINRSQVKKILTSCKGKVILGDFRSFSDQFTSQLVRLHMRDVKQAEILSNYSNEARFDNRALASLKRAERLDITYQQSLKSDDDNYLISDDYEAAKIIRLMKNFCRLSRLKNLYLNFKDVEMTPDLLLNSVLTIANSKIDDWYLDLVLPITSFKDINILKPALEKINVLGIYTGGGYCSEDKVNRFRHKFQKNKILSLFLQENAESLSRSFQVNVYSILRHCNSLQTLLIGSNGAQFLYREDENFLFRSKEQLYEYDQQQQVPQKTESVPWAHNLHSVRVFFPFDTTKLEEESSIHEILRKIQKESKNLKMVDVFTSRSCMIFTQNTRMKKANFYPLISDKLLGLKFLEYINVSIQTAQMEYLDKLVLSCPYLTVLKLKLSHSSSRNYWDDDLPFAKFKNLKELKVSFDSLMEEGLWGDNLAHQISNLQNLEVLSVKIVKPWKMFLRKFCIFLNNTVMLPKLRKLTLKTQIVRSSKENTEEISYEVRDKMISDIQKMIKLMIFVQRKIEFIDIKEFRDSDTNSIFYDRFAIDE